MTFRLIAAVVLIVFYSSYILKMIYQKRQGIHTNQIGKGKTGLVKFVEVTMRFASLLVLFAEIISIYCGKSRASVSFRIIGAVISVIGTAVFIAALLTLRDSWRVGVPETDKTELITDGIYQISRNPAFLGFDLLHIGILFMFFGWILCAATAFAIFMYHMQIVNVEEDFLLASFGDAYLQYKKKVCRYIGRKR